MGASVRVRKWSFQDGLRRSLAAKDQVRDESEDWEGERDGEPERPSHPTKSRILMYPQGHQEKRDVQTEEKQPEHGRRRGRRGLEREGGIRKSDGRGGPSCAVRSGA